MKKINKVNNIIVHTITIDSRFKQNALSNQVNQFHVDLIERRLFQMNLSTEQKLLVIDKIIENLKLQQVHMAK